MYAGDPASLMVLARAGRDPAVLSIKELTQNVYTTGIARLYRHFPEGSQTTQGLVLAWYSWSEYSCVQQSYPWCHRSHTGLLRSWDAGKCTMSDSARLHR